MSKLSLKNNNNKKHNSTHDKEKFVIKEKQGTKNKKQGNFLEHELSNIKLYLNKLKAPTEVEYAGLLRANMMGVMGLGILGYSIKFIHVMINTTLMKSS